MDKCLGRHQILDSISGQHRHRAAVGGVVQGEVRIEVCIYLHIPQRRKQDGSMSGQTQRVHGAPTLLRLSNSCTTLSPPNPDNYINGVALGGARCPPPLGKVPEIRYFPLMRGPHHSSQYTIKAGCMGYIDHFL